MEERGRWITLNNGSHVFLRTGETVGQHFAGKLQKTVPDQFKHGKISDDSLKELQKTKKQADETREEYLKKFSNEVFKDVTNEWLLEHKQKPVVVDENFYMDDDGVVHYNGDKDAQGQRYTIVAGYQNNEEVGAKMLSAETGGTVYKQARVSNPRGIRRADYRQEYKNTKLIEQKEVGKDSTSDDAIFYQARRALGQSDIVMIDLHNKKFSTDKILEQTKKIFKDPATSFVNVLIYTKDGKQIWRIFEKTK